MPGRNYSSVKYRYGFQGQEKDNEIKEDGNALNYTFRVYDPRIGRFFSIDPLTEKYPFYSPYHFSSNQPIHAKELEGMESEFDLNLPASPYDLDENHWKLDPTHMDPNGYKWQDGNGNKLYWSQAKYGSDGKPMPGWEGKDHYHFEDSKGNRYNAAGVIAKSKGANEAHLTPGTQTSIKVKASVSTTEVNGVSSTTTKTSPRARTVSQKINGKLNSVFLVADVVNIYRGFISGDPDALINKFDADGKVGQLKEGTLDFYDMGPYNGDVDLFANYWMVTGELVKEWTENGTKFKTITRYAQHYENKQKVNGRYIGSGEVGPLFRQTQTYRDGKLIDKGKLINPNMDS